MYRNAQDLEYWFGWEHLIAKVVCLIVYGPYMHGYANWSIASHFQRLSYLYVDFHIW